MQRKNYLEKILSGYTVYIKCYMLPSCSAVSYKPEPSLAEVGVNLSGRVLKYEAPVDYELCVSKVQSLVIAPAILFNDLRRR